VILLFIQGTLPLLSLSLYLTKLVADTVATSLATPDKTAAFHQAALLLALAGAVTLDGIDLRQFEIANLRRSISVIFQDYAKYHLTAGRHLCPLI
jgi:hypothetical protein